MKPRFTGIRARLLLIVLVAMLPLAAPIVYSAAKEPRRNAN